MISFPTAKKPTYSTPEDVNKVFNTSKNSGKIYEICENIKNLIRENNIFPKYLDNIPHLINLCNRKEYREFLKRRNSFLINHQLMGGNEFAKLFGNKNLQKKEIDKNKDLVSDKYNKADISQGILGICVFDTFLKQLKETPLFETLIRCSLQRNEKDDGFEKERNEGTLVLRASYEDHTDYIFLTEGMWEGFLNGINGGEEVTFKGKVIAIDGAAGSHYYNAEYVEQLEIIN